jgi:hypothetical protein
VNPFISLLDNLLTDFQQVEKLLQMDAMGAGSMRTSLLRSALQVTRRARSFLPLPLRNSASLKSRGLSVETWLTQEDLRLPSLKVVKLWSHHNLQQHDLVDYPSLIPP